MRFYDATFQNQFLVNLENRRLLHDYLNIVRTVLTVRVYFAFIKPTPNAQPFTHEVTLFE
jgi:hypothetical protein